MNEEESIIESNANENRYPDEDRIPKHEEFMRIGIIEQKIKEQKDLNIGYDAASCSYVNMFEAGIVDPLKVTNAALQVATSIAGLLTETSAIVFEKAEKDKAPEMPMGGGMGGY